MCGLVGRNSGQVNVICLREVNPLKHQGWLKISRWIPQKLSSHHQQHENVLFMRLKSEKKIGRNYRMGMSNEFGSVTWLFFKFGSVPRLLIFQIDCLSTNKKGGGVFFLFFFCGIHLLFLRSYFQKNFQITKTLKNNNNFWFRTDFQEKARIWTFQMCPNLCDLWW